MEALLQAGLGGVTLPRHFRDTSETLPPLLQAGLDPAARLRPSGLASPSLLRLAVNSASSHLQL